MQKFWLMKSEPSEVSVDDALAAPKATVTWTGVRNYQARNCKIYWYCAGAIAC